jgi:DivIVA domain-containing protein
MRHTRRIAAHGYPPHGQGPHEQVTGSLERLSAAGVDQDQLIAQVRAAAFPLALRGYDREAVDAYVKRVNRLVTDLEASRSPEAAIRRALDQVGEETSGILQRAQETANEITERSRASADDRIREAEREARALTAEAEERVRELEADFGEIWARRDRLLDEVRDLAERLLAIADDSGERFPTQDEEVAEATRADTASFPQLEPPEEDTTVSVSFEAGAATAPDPPGDAGEPPIGPEEPSGNEEAFGDDPTPRTTPPDDAPHAGDEPARVELRPADEMDFADPVEEPDQRERGRGPAD